MRNEIVKCKHCGIVIIDCTWEEWTEFRNSKEAEIERHECECEENPNKAICTCYSCCNETEVKQEYLVYLDLLRESGVTNMFGAGQYIQKEFAVDKKTASTILKYWMQSFGERK